MNLHHVQLAMPRGEEERARRFYVETLGMEEVDKPPVLAARGGVWFRRGELELHLGVEEEFVPARKAHPGILTDDIDGLAERLTTSGVEVRWDDAFPGHRRFYVDDCFGNRLELLQPAPAKPPVLTTPRLTLRPYGPEDIDAVFGHANEESFGRYIPSVPWPYTREDAADFVRRAITKDPDVTPMFAIEHDGRLIGGCNLHAIDHDAGTAGTGYALGRQWRGEGFGSEAAARLLEYAFEELGLALVYAFADPRNAASCRVMEKVGMQHEGTLRGRDVHRGERCDRRFYSILREEWSSAGGS